MLYLRFINEVSIECEISSSNYASKYPCMVLPIVWIMIGGVRSYDVCTSERLKFWGWVWLYLKIHLPPALILSVSLLVKYILSPFIAMEWPIYCLPQCTISYYDILDYPNIWCHNLLSGLVWKVYCWALDYNAVLHSCQLYHLFLLRGHLMQLN